MSGARWMTPGYAGMIAVLLCSGCGGEAEPDGGDQLSALAGRVGDIADDYAVFAQDPDTAGQTFDAALGGDAFGLISARDPSGVWETIQSSWVDPNREASATNTHEVAVANELFKMSLVLLALQAAVTLPEVDDEVLVAAGVDPAEFRQSVSQLELLAQEAAEDLETHLDSVLTATSDAFGPPYPEATSDVVQFDATTALEAASLALSLIISVESAGVTVRGWDPKAKEAILGAAEADTVDSVMDDLQKIVVLCFMMTDPEYVFDSNDVTELQSALDSLAQLDTEAKFQQAMQTLSNVSKARHDVAMKSIQNTRA